MGENLTVDDVQAYTRGRLPADNPETQRALDAALARVRHYCGWHVSPRISETITLNGTGRALLFVPTLRIVELLSVSEDGVELDGVRESANAPGALAKAHWANWGLGNIEVEIEYGYTAAEAADWREAVLALVDRASQLVGVAGPLVEVAVDDVSQKFADAVATAALHKAVVSRYRLVSFG